MATKATARNVDFSGVKDGGNFNKKRIPAGDYLAKIVKVEDAVSSKDKVPQYLFSIKILKHPSSVLPYYCKLQENQLWKLRNILIAAGKAVPKSKQKVDVNLIVGKTIGVTIADTEYDPGEGKAVQKQSEIDGVFPAAELADDPNAAVEDVDDEESEEDEEDADLPLDDMGTDEPDEADEEEAEDEADDEEEAEQGDEYDAMDRNQLKAALKAQDSNFQARKSQTDDDLRALLRESAGGDDEEDEEEEPAPVAKTKRKAKPKASDVTDDELDELNIDEM